MLSQVASRKASGTSLGRRTSHCVLQPACSSVVFYTQPSAAKLSPSVLVKCRRRSLVPCKALDLPMQSGAAKPASQPSASPATAKPSPAGRHLPTMAAAASAAPAADTSSQQRQQPQQLSSQDGYPASYSAGQYPLFPQEPAFEPYRRAEEQSMCLLLTDNLDAAVKADPGLTAEFDQAVDRALATAYSTDEDAAGSSASSTVHTTAADSAALLSDRDAAHLFLQRVLYRVNRLVLFWFDDLANYKNERSQWLAGVRDSLEGAWQGWELAQVDVAGLQALTPQQVKEELRARAAQDVDPAPGPEALYMRQAMSLEGYRHLLAITSLDGLVEASRQSRVYGGVANEVQCAGFKVLMEEYGVGRLHKKHSTFFASMMAELGLEPQPEGYMDTAPWQLLACANHNFLLSERRAHYLRYNGGLTYFEVAGPAAYTTYLKAAQRLGLSDVSSGYWALHIKEDERHGRQMVEDVACPLVDMYPGQAWQLLLGYQQDKDMGARAGQAIVAAIKALEARREAEGGRA